MIGTLYVVATPLGNLADLSPRAVKVLAEVALIACEDTRHTRKLLTHFQIRTPTTSYHEHNEAEKAPQLVQELKSGMNLALVCDAGTPLVSDPGYRLVRLCRNEQIPVLPIPGPCAATAALSVSGLATDRFMFVGFLPHRAAARKTLLQQLAGLPTTLVFYLSPHALVSSLHQLLEYLGNREAFLIREMTKVYETSYSGSLAPILHTIEQQPPRGEYTLVVEGAASPTRPPIPDVRARVAAIMDSRKLTLKEAIKVAARDLGLSRRDVYKQVSDD